MIRLLAIAVLAIHLIWILLVVVGALWTRGRRVWSAVHITALLWGIAVEVGPWPCPLTLVEEYFETRAGVSTTRGEFLLRCLDMIVYPDLAGWLVTTLGVAVCCVNLGIYGWRLRQSWKQPGTHSDTEKLS